MRYFEQCEKNCALEADPNDVSATAGALLNNLGVQSKSQGSLPSGFTAKRWETQVVHPSFRADLVSFSQAEGDCKGVRLEVRFFVGILATC